MGLPPTSDIFDAYKNGEISKEKAISLLQKENSIDPNIEFVTNTLNRFESVDHPGEELLETVWLCFYLGYEVPEWAKIEFFDAYRLYYSLDGEADTDTPLVGAFKTDPKAGKHRKAKRRERNLKTLVILEVLNITYKGDSDYLPLTDETFDIVAEKFGISKTQVSSWYYGAVTRIKDQSSTSTC